MIGREETAERSGARAARSTTSLGLLVPCSFSTSTGRSSCACPHTSPLTLTSTLIHIPPSLLLAFSATCYIVSNGKHSKWPPAFGTT